MSATIFNPPAEIKQPEYDWKNAKNWLEQDEKYRNDLREYLKNGGYPQNDYCGQCIYFPVADSNAEYMVASLRPLQLIHLPLGDAWQYPNVDLMTAKRVKEMIDANKRMAELFPKRG